MTQKAADLRDEYGEWLASFGVPQLSNGLEFNLAYPFASEIEALADFFERVLGGFPNPVAHSHNFFLAGRQESQCVFDLFAK